jgi:hypothetical protein
VNERIVANQNLLRIQRELARAQLATVQNQIGRATETSLLENINPFSAEARARTVLSARASAAATDPNRPGLVDPERRKEEFLRLLDEEIEKNESIRLAGGTLSDQQIAAYKIKADYLNLLEQERALTEEVAAINRTPFIPNTDFRDELGQDFYIDPNAPRTRKPLTDKEREALEKERKAAANAAALRVELERTFDLQIAQASNDEDRIRAAEYQLELARRISSYVEARLPLEQATNIAVAELVAIRSAETAELQRQADLERQKREDAAALAIEQAQADRALILARAKGNDDEIRALEEILDFRRRVAEYESKGLSAADAIDQAEADIRAVNALRQSEMRQAIADEIAAGLTEGIRTGDWGTVFKDILAKSTTDALSDAINDLASILTDLFSSAIKGLGGSAGGSIGASIGSIFLGNRAGGGSVAAGMRYIVGEQGPEMFVPSVPGTIVPQFEGPASAAANGVMGVQSLSITAPFIVQGSITEEVFPRVQAMMAAQARELPRIIDARVTDSLRRNRY